MATVLIQHGEQGTDGTPPPRAYFQLIEGKLHIPTIRDYFRLANVALDGVVYPIDPEGFTFSTFQPNTQARVTGDPIPGGSRLTRVLLIRTNEVYGESDQPGGKRRVMQVEENLGLWTLPPPESQPRTLADLTAALRTYLQIEHNVTWLFRYRYQNELVPIVSDSALAGALDYFRAQAAHSADDEQCRLYLNTTSEEMAPRDLIRARITGILDAAAAHSGGRESPAAAAATPAAAASSAAPPGGPSSLQPGSLSSSLLLPGVDGAAAALLGGHHSQHSAAAAAAAALAAAGFTSYGFQLAQQHSDTAGQQDVGSYGMGTDLDGDDGEDGDTQGEGGPMSSLLGIPRQSGSEGNMMGGQGGAGQIKKESKTRHADGRFKNEAQHAKKMSDMSRKIAELFDGHIVQMVEVCDHKKIMCLLCSHACTAYSAYHTDCVRKHFLRHHENTLRERGVDVARWRKEYEVSQKVKRQQQQPTQSGGEQPHPHPHAHQQQLVVGAPGQQLQAVTVGNLLQAAAVAAAASGGGPPGALQQLSLPALLSALQANSNAVAVAAAGGGGGGGGAEGDVAQRVFQLDLQSLFAQQAVGAGAAPAGPGGVGMQVSSLMLQAQAMSHDEHIQMQAAGAALSGLLSAGSVGSGGGPPTAAGSLASQLSGALIGSASGPVSLAPMARMASGTVTTEMALPLPPASVHQQPPPPPPVSARGGGEPEVGALPLSPPLPRGGLTRSGSVASQGHGSLPSIRSPPAPVQVVTTDMGRPPSC